MLRPPLDVVHLFPILDEALLNLLRTLTPEQWEMPTLARHWKVRDVVAHLLDGNIRALSVQRDRYFGVRPTYDVTSMPALIQWLNELNADWVKAAQRISPAVLILLHEATGQPTCDYYASLAPEEEAIFSVAWAGESRSTNRMHLAREYTEKWLHQQQIRHAIGLTAPLMERQLYFPLIDTFMRALPHTFRDIPSPPSDTCIMVSVSGPSGGDWYLTHRGSRWHDSANSHWELSTEPAVAPSTTLTMQPDTAWMLFSKGISPEVALAHSMFSGNGDLAQAVLSMVAIMG